MSAAATRGEASPSAARPSAGARRGCVTGAKRRRNRAQGALALSLALFASGLTAFAAARVERVSFASLDLDRDGQQQKIDAVLYRPAEPSRRLPAVVALHGCAGLYRALRNRRDELALRHARMGEMLAAEGFAVLFPDSFRSRGFDELCSQPIAGRTVTVAHRRLDVLGALAFLQARDDIFADRIGLLGWSHGGSTLLEVMNAAAESVRRFREMPGAPPFFRRAVAFYPGCVAARRARPPFAPAAELLLLVGAKDDWTAPGPCVALVDALRARGEAASVVVYPDSFHGFDGPGAPKPVHLDHPNGVRPGQGVTVAVNPVAREDAHRRVKAFLHALAGP